MRRRLIALLVLLPALAFAATPARLETRTPAHALTVDVVPIGDGVQYVVRVTDLGSGELLAEGKFDADQHADVTAETHGLKTRIHLQATYNGIFASAQINQGDTIIDSMDARWALKPTRQVRVTPPPGVARVGGDVKAPAILQKVEPVYTEEARKARVSGIVILEALIDKNGDVSDVTVLKPLPFGLDQSAIDAVKQWKFKPAVLNGQAVDVLFNLTVNFKLDAGKQEPPPERNR